MKSFISHYTIHNIQYSILNTNYSKIKHSLKGVKMKKLILFFLLVLTISITGSKSVYSDNEMFKSVASGNWNSNSTWAYSTNGGTNWYSAISTPNAASGAILISSFTVVTITANVTADQITVQSGAVVSINSGITFTYPGNANTFTLEGVEVSGEGTFKAEGPMTIDIRAGSVFSAALKVASGTVRVTDLASPRIGRLYGPVTVDSGAVLTPNVSSLTAYGLEIYGNLTNNGTLTSAGTNSNYISFKGPAIVNNGSIVSSVFNLDTTSTISGAGSWSPTVTLGISANVEVTMMSDINFSPGGTLLVSGGGILNPNGFNVNFTSGTFTLNSGATVLNSGLFKTRNNVNINVRAGSFFNVNLKVENGITSAADYSSPRIGSLYGNVTVDPGATLSATETSNVYYNLQFYGNLTNNGTLSSAGATAKTMTMKGSSMINNGSIVCSNFNIDSTATISGTGSWSPYTILGIGANGNVTLMSDVNFSPGSGLTVTSGGILNPNGYNVNYSSGTFTLNSGATVVNSGLFKTQNTVNINVRAGSFFNVPLKVLSGITSAADYSSPRVGSLFGDVTVDSGATLSATESTNFSYNLQFYGNLINNGTLSSAGASGKTMTLKSASMINNGLVKTSKFNFETFANLGGTGSFTSDITVLSGSAVTLTSDHQFKNMVINAGGSFDISNRQVGFTASNPITQNGTFITANSDILYNGTALQSISTTNINYVGLKLNNPAGATLTNNITIPDTLSVILGDLNLNGKIITLTPDAYMTETPGNTVYGTTGYITTTRNIGTPNNLNVGGIGAVLTASSSLGSTEIRRGHTVQTGLNGGTSIKRYYDITPTNNSGLNATLVFKFDDSELNLKPEPSLKLFKSTNAGSTWIYMGGTVNIATNEITLSGLTSFSRWSADSSGVSAAITTLMQGFYNNVTNQLSMSDTVRAYLRNTFAPYAVVDSSIGIIDSLTFKASYQFPNAPDGNYYIQLKHRNSLETWSKFGVNYQTSITLNYDFTFAASQSYGNNTILKGSKYCMYSGDVTQDGYIDLADVVNIYNNGALFVNGYVATDVNGDLITDLADVLIAYNNAIVFVSAKYPA